MFPGMKQFADLISQAMEARIWQDDGAVKLYLYCLSRASHNAFKWHGLPVQPGDLPLSERHTAGALIWSRNKLDRKLSVLEEAGLITVRSLSRTGTMVHIVHWPEAVEAVSVWLQDEATNEASLAGDGSMVRPETVPGTRPAQDDDEDRHKSGFITEPDRPHSEAIKHAAGSTMEPNPIKKNSTASFSVSEPQGFTRVWIAYPAHRRNQRREAAWLVAKALEDGATIESILSALETEKQSDAWREESGRFVPGMVKWLEKETWRSFIQQAEPVEEEERWTSW